MYVPMYMNFQNELTAIFKYLMQTFRELKFFSLNNNLIFNNYYQIIHHMCKYKYSKNYRNYEYNDT